MKKILSKLSRGRRGATPSRPDSPRCAAELAWWASPRAAGRSISVVALCSLLAGTLGGCSGPTISETDGSDVAASSSTSTSTEAASFEEVAAAFDVAALDLEYSNRDKDASYDDASATHIVLSGATATVDGDGASVEGSTVTISAEGTYVVSGSLDDGRLVVEVADTDKVQVVLNGASIHNEDGPAFYVRQADKCFVTLADGTTNTLTDGTDYVLEDGSDEPYATLFSRADLTLNGSGTLTVTSSYRHAVCSKDDLVITGGTYVVDAVEDALRGRDCVKIADGDFTLTAGGDGIKSNKDTKATKGFVSIDGGTFTIQAGDDGIQAQTYLRIAGG
nr:carbohydrate-binding domain-containing protein [Gordonibacter urolithinfaciens]